MGGVVAVVAKPVKGEVVKERYSPTTLVPSLHSQEKQESQDWTISSVLGVLKLSLSVLGQIC